MPEPHGSSPGEQTDRMTNDPSPIDLLCPLTSTSAEVLGVAWHCTKPTPNMSATDQPHSVASLPSQYRLPVRQHIYCLHLFPPPPNPHPLHTLPMSLTHSLFPTPSSLLPPPHSTPSSLPPSSASSWSSWGSWGECSSTCQGGTRMRQRTCQNGNSCPGASIEVVYCNSNVPCGSQRKWCRGKWWRVEGGREERAPWLPHAAPLAVLGVAGCQ